MSFLRNALLCTALLAAPSGWAQSDMSDAERDALHAEIRGYLLENPEIIMEVIGILDERRALGEAAAEASLVTDNSSAIYDDGYSFVGGNPDGDITIVEFVDYQCGFCRKSHPEVRELISADGGIRLIIKELPILGPGSELASRAAISTLISEGPEAYERLNLALMTLQGQVTEASLDSALAEAGLDVATIRAGMDAAEVTRRLEDTRGLAQALAISGTPTFVFGDRMVRGYVELAAMRGLVEELRATN
jgi:protein-disulfide isomerase